jgi:hypothetical protein
MGAGIDPKRLHRMKYNRLKTIQIQLHNDHGILSEYKNLEVHGKHFVVYFAGAGPASNGESAHWIVLRFNPDNQPVAGLKHPGDIDYTDFHTRDITEMDKGGFDAGIERVKEELDRGEPLVGDFVF